jgi:tetratricopeptide (TPR) repeat protein
MLREPGLAAITDLLGRYLFRDLAAGAYTLSVRNEPQTPSQTVRLGSQPIDLTNVDFQLVRTGASEAPAPMATPVPVAIPALSPLPIQPLPPPALLAAALPDAATPATAELHNARGRELTAAGRYREAIVELTEALRMAPNLALAWNARGFVRLLLHEWARAIENENQAILLNPSYANAYRIRAAARRSAGDAAGAAADQKRAQGLRSRP